MIEETKSNLEHQSPTTGALIGVLQDARDAIASLDEDALGYAHDAQNTVCWPIRDELMAKIGSALDEALSRPSPIEDEWRCVNCKLTVCSKAEPERCRQCGLSESYVKIAPIAEPQDSDAAWLRDTVATYFFREQRDRLERIAARLEANMPQDSEAYNHARRLAEALHAKHYSEIDQWKPLPDLLGVIDQIDNMTTGLARLEAQCPSCGGLNISCPEGCGRDPKTGELNGTRLEAPIAEDALVEALKIISEGSRLGLEVFERRVKERNGRLTWFAVNVLEHNLAACEGTATAALQAIHEKKG